MERATEVADSESKSPSGWAGRRAIITSLDKAIEALDGETGTEIVKD